MSTEKRATRTEQVLVLDDRAGRIIDVTPLDGANPALWYLCEAGPGELSLRAAPGAEGLQAVVGRASRGLLVIDPGGEPPLVDGRALVDAAVVCPGSSITLRSGTIVTLRLVRRERPADEAATCPSCGEPIGEDVLACVCGARMHRPCGLAAGECRACAHPAAWICDLCREPLDVERVGCRACGSSFHRECALDGACPRPDCGGRMEA